MTDAEVLPLYLLSPTMLVLLILDGYGHATNRVGNAIKEAYTPTLRMIERTYPSCLLQASGLAVGLPYSEAGNSEVGHLNIGAGRIVEQYLPRINRAIKDGSFGKLEALHGAFLRARASHGRVHIAGLLTSGTVHASFEHLEALLDIAAEYNDVPLMIHCFTDGKDSGLQEAPRLLERLEGECRRRSVGCIASMVGRKIAMDRDNNWQATEKAYRLLAFGEGERVADVGALIERRYEIGQNDQTLEPIVNDSCAFSGIQDGDALIFWNYREDAIRQLARAWFQGGFNQFAIKAFSDFYGAVMTHYEDGLTAHVAFPLPVIQNSLAEVVSVADRKQLHITETEKYAHVTYFFDGLRKQPFAGEEWVLLETNRDFIGFPEMQAAPIAERIVQEIKRGAYDLIVANFPNADILAHTGNFQATVQGIEAIDRQLLSIHDAVIKQDGILIITADHGNAEALTYRGTGEQETRHDDSPVPLFLCQKDLSAPAGAERSLPRDADGVLADIAPTVLELMGIEKPSEMDGSSLISVLNKV